MATRTDCYPWWHEPLTALIAQPWAKTLVPSGCPIVSGNATCAPEQMRANSEAWLKQRYPQVLVQLGGSLTLKTYTLGRYLHSEQGNGTAEERVAVAEAGLNEAARSNRTLLQMLAPQGYFGPIHADESVCLARGYARGTRQNRCGTSKNSHTCCAPYGRWAATTRDPSIASLVCAHYVVTGQTDNFARGAVTQWGPEAWINDGQAALNNFVKNIAASDNFYWIGDLPGVDPFGLFLVRKGVPLGTLKATALAEGQRALALPRKAPPTLTLCPEGPGGGGGPSGGEIVLAVAGLAAGVFAGRFAARRLGFMV
jgi:hypothetical protein